MFAFFLQGLKSLMDVVGLLPLKFVNCHTSAKMLPMFGGKPLNLHLICSLDAGRDAEEEEPLSPEETDCEKSSAHCARPQGPPRIETVTPVFAGITQFEKKKIL